MTEALHYELMGASDGGPWWHRVEWNHGRREWVRIPGDPVRVDGSPYPVGTVARRDDGQWVAVAGQAAMLPQPEVVESLYEQQAQVEAAAERAALTEDEQRFLDTFGMTPGQAATLAIKDRETEESQPPPGMTDLVSLDSLDEDTRPEGAEQLARVIALLERIVDLLEPKEDQGPLFEVEHARRRRFTIPARDLVRIPGGKTLASVPSEVPEDVDADAYALTETGQPQPWPVVRLDPTTWMVTDDHKASAVAIYW